MSKENVRFDIGMICQLLLTLAELLVMTNPAAAQGINEKRCVGWRPLATNDRFETVPAESAGDCYVIEIHAPGTLVIQVTARGREQVEPVLDLVPESAPFSLRGRTPDHMVLEISAPGTLGISVAAQDPWAELPSYILTSRFVEQPPKSDKDGGDGDGGAEEEGEIDPILICLPPGDDDHGDLASAATPVNPAENMSGSLSNRAAVDDDYFTFVLERQQTVVITTDGETDTFGVLSDDRGYRLAVDDNGGSGTNFRIGKTLVPGRYFIRVEGSWAAEGPYTLRIDQ